MRNETKRTQNFSFKDNLFRIYDQSKFTWSSGMTS